ncbi:MAG: polyketide cyclase [Rhodobacterales bacterium]|nr:MAG: polyketide cyclase [Rhodobacterales bacterium]
MTDFETTHDTFTIHKTYDCAPSRLFAAFSDPSLKKEWFAESPAYEALEYDLDFKPGGKEVLTAKMLPSTPVAGAVLRWTSEYGAIEPDARIVFHQNVEMNDRCISCAVITLEFLPTQSGCDLKLTHQAVFFEGSDGPEVRKMGWEALLTSLESTTVGS